MKKTAGAFILIFAAILAACQVIAGIERVDKVTEPSGASSTSSSSSSSGGIKANDPCQHVLAPKIPAQSDPGADVPPFYVATQTLSLTAAAANGISGVDLDGTCTCDKRAGVSFDGGPSCNPPSGGQVICDPDGGIDNEGQTLFAQLFAAVEAATKIDYQQSLNDDIASGHRTIMLFVQGWNGQKNDIDVQTSLFISNGTLPPDDGSGNPNTTPNFDGNDVWSYPSSLHPVNGAIVPGTTQPGYIADGKLVVQNNLTVTIIFGTAGLPFGDAVVLGDLTMDPTSKLAKFVGIIGGRIKQTDLLGAAGQIRASNSNYVCNDNGGIEYTLVKQGICPTADIGSTQETDFKNATCDSISATLAISGIQAKVGGTTFLDPVDNGPNPCAPGQPGAPSYTCP